MPSTLKNLEPNLEESHAHTLRLAKGNRWLLLAVLLLLVLGQLSRLLPSLPLSLTAVQSGEESVAHIVHRHATAHDGMVGNAHGMFVARGIECDRHTETSAVASFHGRSVSHPMGHNTGFDVFAHDHGYRPHGFGRKSAMHAERTRVGPIADPTAPHAS